MNEINLSMRLLKVAEALPEGRVIADIGSDHAYLPCYLCGNGKIPAAIAGEVSDGPFLSALSQVKQLNLTDRISVRKGNGLQVLESGEVEVIVIAGMGGKLISEILESGKEKLLGVSRLVLQPNVDSESVRRWLIAHDWQLRSESILEEDGHIYEILSAEPGKGWLPYEETGETGIRMGPYLMKEKNTAFRKKWRREIEKWKRVEKQMEHAADQERLVEKKSLLRERIHETEEMLGGENSERTNINPGV
ncbi:MAG TPA: tRNA (adenine(22)-N(1))-methyltransferase TrmK [Bacillales bacterium]|nr:tRNA (adenine(22)-N(1))-methyltransferase TrmK [Bacillales bacterium]